MLSLAAEYAGQSSAKNIQSDWLLELDYGETTLTSGTLESGKDYVITDFIAGDDFTNIGGTNVDGNRFTASGTTPTAWTNSSILTPMSTEYFSGSDRTITNFYHGNVIDWGQIDESINLKDSSSAISDVQITLANSYANLSGLLSAELFGGSKKFINQDVVIKSWIPNLALTNCLTIYKGRLVDIKHNQSTVTLSIEKRSPWDRVKITPTKSTVKNIGFPEVYGDYTKNTAGTFSAGKAVYPAPINDVSGESIVPLIADTTYTFPASIPFLHYYDKNLDDFLAVDNVASWYSNAIDYQGGKAAYVDQTLSRDFWHRPTNLTERIQGLTNPANAIDTDDTTYAIKTYSPTSTSNNFFYLYIEPPKVTGKITGIKLNVKYNLKSGEGLSSGTVTVAIYDVSYGLADPERNLIATLTTLNSSATGTASADWFNADNYSAGDTMPENIILQAVLDSPTGYLDQGQVWIYDVYLDVQAAVDFTDEQSASNELNAIDLLYCGNDGYDNGWTDGSGTSEYPCDIYRDLLDRYAGWDATSEDHVEVNGVDWSTWASSGRDWDCRWWTLEQKSLLPILSQLQIEGGFIWIFDETTSGREARIIYVKSSYASADFDIDYNDITNLDISMSPFSEIVTKRTFNYQRHPADEKRYLQTESLENANRTDWNLEALENAIEQDLDFLTAESDVEDLLEYYDNIVGEPKLLVKCDLLKPKDWALQVGDIVKFENMVYEPYGKSWATPIYFMCVRTLISPNKFTANFREVG